MKIKSKPEQTYRIAYATTIKITYITTININLIRKSHLYHTKNITCLIISTSNQIYLNSARSLS